MTNAERYKSAKERAEAFAKYCKATHCSGSWCDAFSWLDLEAPAEEPLPCPFCGAKVFIYTNSYNNMRFYVCEKKCGYTSQYRDSDHEAVAAHNRVARAVAKGGNQ